MKNSLLILAIVLLSIIPIASAANITGLDGLAVYTDFENPSVNNRINYTFFNKTRASFESNITSLGFGSDVKWTVLRNSPTRDEYLLIAQDNNNDVRAQVFNGTSWISQINVSFEAKSPYQRQIDAAYESLSGNGLIAYENSNSADKVFGLRAWNGSSWTNEANITTSLSSSQLRWVDLVPDPASNKIMILVHNDLEELYAVVWNGTDVLSNTNLSMNKTSISTREHFMFAWESQSHDGLLVYGNGSVSPGEYAYRTFNSASNAWSGRATFLDLNLSANGGIAHVARLCPDPTSDYIGFISQDSTDDVNIRIWNGTGVEQSPSPPSEDDTTHSGSYGSANLDCAWAASGSKALFGFIDYNSTSNDRISYVTYNKSSYSVSNLESATLSFIVSPSDGPITYLDFIPNPAQDDVMAITLDNDNTIRAVRWDGNTFNSTIFVLTTNAECKDTDTQCGSFEWRRHGPDILPPAITSLALSPNPLNPNSTIYINATITDETSLGAVILQVNFSNGTFTNYSTAAVGNVYYNNSVTTDFIGNASVRWFANDTLGYANNTEKSTFAVRDLSSPNVTSLTKTPNPVALLSSIELNATIADNIQIDTVKVQLNFSNGTFTNYSASLNNGRYFNRSLPTSAIGLVSFAWFANDSSGNINSSERSSYTVADTTTPSVTSLAFSPNPVNQNGVIYVNATILDNAGVSIAIIQANFTNGTFANYSASNISTNYFNSSIPTGMIDNVTIRWFVNDTSGNANATEKSSFSVRNAPDTAAPSISITSPSNNTNFTSAPIYFNFTATDNTISMSCSLILNNIVNATNSTVLNNTPTSFSIGNLADGNYSWKINCTDSSSNENSSAIFNFTKIVQASSSEGSSSGGGGGGSSRTSASTSSSSAGITGAATASSESSSGSSSSGSSASSDSESAESSGNLESGASSRITGQAVSGTPTRVYVGGSMLLISLFTFAWAFSLIKRYNKKDNPLPTMVSSPGNFRKVYVKPQQQKQVIIEKQPLPQKPSVSRSIEFSELKRYFPQTLGSTEIHRKIDITQRAPAIRPQVIAASRKQREVYSMLEDMGINTGSRDIHAQQPQAVQKRNIPKSYPRITTSGKADMLSKLKNAYS